MRDSLERIKDPKTSVHMNLCRRHGPHLVRCFELLGHEQALQHQLGVLRQVAAPLLPRPRQAAHATQAHRQRAQPGVVRLGEAAGRVGQQLPHLLGGASTR